MLYSVLPPIAPVPVSLGGRQSIHSSLSRPVSPGISPMPTHSQSPHPIPYPSPPMSGSSPPETLSPLRHTVELSRGQERETPKPNVVHDRGYPEFSRGQERETPKPNVAHNIGYPNISRGQERETPKPDVVHDPHTSPDAERETLRPHAPDNRNFHYQKIESVIPYGGPYVAVGGGGSNGGNGGTAGERGGDSRMAEASQLDDASSSSNRSSFEGQNSSILAQPQRRTKSHVASACVNCKKAHLACDVRRPCPRCIGLGKQDSCRDVQHKKRGRPRLRDERSHNFEINHIATHPPRLEPMVVRSPLSYTATSYRPNTHRVLKANSVDMPAALSRSQINAAHFQQSAQITRYIGEQSKVEPRLDPRGDLHLYLTTDLTIAWSSTPLRELLGYQEREINGVKTLFDVVNPDDRNALARLSRMVQQEVQVLDPIYRPPPISAVYSCVQGVPFSEAMAAAAPQTKIFEETVDLLLPGQYLCRTVIQARLVRPSVFFVVAELTPYHRPARLSPVSPIGYMPSSTFRSHPEPVESHGRPQHQQHPGLHLQPLNTHTTHPTRGLPSPADSRPRSVHAESMAYPSLAGYANPTTPPHHQSAHNAPFSSQYTAQKPRPSNNLTLPPLRELNAPSTMEMRDAHQFSDGRLGSERLTKRIAVQDVLQ